MLTTRSIRNDLALNLGSGTSLREEYMPIVIQFHDHKTCLNLTKTGIRWEKENLVTVYLFQDCQGRSYEELFKIICRTTELKFRAQVG